MTTKVITSIEAAAILDRTGGLPETNLDVSGVTWIERGPAADRRSRLEAVVTLLGAIMVMDAYALEYQADNGTRVATADPDDDLELRIVDAPDGANVETLWTAHGMRGAIDPLEIGGRRYAVFMRPSCL